MKLKKVQRTLIALTLTCAMAVTPVFAAPEDAKRCHVVYHKPYMWGHR